MANRRFEQFQLSLEKKIVTLWGNVAIGAVGAPTMSVAKSKGIASVSRISAGKYTITLQDAYQYLVFFDAVILAAAGAPASGTNVNCIIRNDNTAVASAPSVVIEFVNSAGVAVELATSATVLFEFTLKNSSV